MFDLLRYRAAGYAAVAVETVEEPRLSEWLLSHIDDDAPIWRVTCAGATDVRTGQPLTGAHPYPFLWQRLTMTPDVVAVVTDWHHLCQQPAAHRPLIDALAAMRSQGSLAVLCAPSWQLPPELQHEIPVLQHALPDAEALGVALRVVAEAAEVSLGDDQVAALTEAGRGLTLSEAEGVYALSVRDGLARAAVERHKAALVRQTPGLESWEPLPAARLGGLGRLRDWIAEEVAPSRRDPDLRVKGWLLVGPPGTGKSLAARVSAAMLGLPLVRLDVAAIMGSLVGQSESQIRAALTVVEATAPCVLWIDEIDSALGGHVSSAATDGGTTGRVVSTLLTWLQETAAAVTTVATANYPERVPPALLRPGRLDAIWSIDLPTRSERVEIAAVHMRHLGCEVDGHAGALADATADYSGAEIAAAVLSAARRSGRRPTRQHLLAAAGEITPLARSRQRELEEMRAWARTYARPASEPEVVSGTTTTTTRRVRAARSD